MDNIEIEEWKVVNSKSKSYMVSNIGRVKSCARTIVGSNRVSRKLREKILKQRCDADGYPLVHIDAKTIKVPKIVAEAFIGQRPSGMEIRHLDGNPRNNKIENLAYGTHSENVLDGYSYCGKIKKNQKLTCKQVLEIITRVSSGERAKKLSIEYGVSQTLICDIKYGKTYGSITKIKDGKYESSKLP